MKQPESLQHVEYIDCNDSIGYLNDNQIDTFFMWAPKIKNINTLKVCKHRQYDIPETKRVDFFGKNLNYAIERLPKLHDLILGFSQNISPANLLDLIESGKQLEQLLVLFDHSIERSNDEHTQEIVEIVPKHRKTNPLNVIIVGNENQLRPFREVFPTDAQLKVTCVPIETALSIVNLESWRNGINNDQIELLRQGVLLL